MSQARFFTDEDVYGVIAVRLRNAGFDAISTPEAGRLCQSDPSQLRWFAQQGCVLLSFNVHDFARLHYDWMSWGEHHAGLIVSQQRPIGDMLRRLIHLGQTLSAEEMLDRLGYLSSW